jgi:DNA-binding transcriptional LysR family regulator
VKLSELADEQFVIFSRASAPAHHDKLIASLSQAGIHPRIGHRAQSWINIVAMVAQDRGVALVPKSMARTRLAGASFVSLNGPRMPAPAMLVWNPKLVAPALASFLACAAVILLAPAVVTRQRAHVLQPSRPFPSKNHQ